MILSSVCVIAIAVAGGGASSNKGTALPLAYGGILAAFDQKPDIRKKDFVKAIEYAQKHVEQSLQRCFSKRLLGQAIVTLSSKHTLKHTDKKTPPYTPHVTTVHNHQRSSKQRRAVILGINYHFDLEWCAQCVPLSPPSLCLPPSPFPPFSSSSSSFYSFIVFIPPTSLDSG